MVLKYSVVRFLKKTFIFLMSLVGSGCFAFFASIINISAKNHRNIKKFMTVEKNFSKAVFWDQAQRSSLIRLKVTTVRTQSKRSIGSPLVGFGNNYF